MTELNLAARWAAKNNARQTAPNATAQNAPIPGTNQVENSAGGFAWAVDDWTRLNRFLILGTEGGSYYAAGAKLTLDSANAALRCIELDGARTVQTTVEVSQAGRAPKNDPALFVLALCAAKGDDATRKLALTALPQVARTGTHLMHFAAFVDEMRGWGRGLRAAVADWYNAKPASDVAYQALKYQARDGWSQRDLLRLAHPKPATDSHKTIYHWITQGWDWVGLDAHPDEALRQIWAMERVKRATSADEVAVLILEQRLPREAVPTQWLNEAVVWEALLEEMPMTALIRNLATITRTGLLSPGSAWTKRVVAQLSDVNRLRKARVHPIAVLAAMKTYASGQGVRGTNTWQPTGAIVDALDAAFYASFGNVKATGKRFVLALDVSGSMTCGNVAGVPGLTPRVASSAMALVTAATEANYQVVAFTSGPSGYGGQWGGGAPALTVLPITPRQRLDDVLKTVDNLPFGGTDCAQPMLWALKEKVEADAFIIYTDSETWHGKIHPSQALGQYRDKTGIAAKLIVCGMVANNFSIADPNDGAMLDVVGFDTAAPNVMSDFVRGEV